MSIKLYQVDVAFGIEPLWKELAPRVLVCLDEHKVWDGPISHTRIFRLSRQLLWGSHSLTIELVDKSDLDSAQAIKINDLTIGDISSPRFVLRGYYRPRSPEPWATQQREKGTILQPEISNTDYLGWNGIWRLDFTAPVFTWIHQVEDLGWIYE
jgi:hypothetical protein